jgi:hypothetical protein
VIKVDAIRKFALSLPDAEERPHFHLTSFRVGGKIFMTVPPEQDHLRIFVGGDEREAALVVHAHCVEKLWWGDKVCGLRINLATATLPIAKQLIEAAWKAKVPKDRAARSGTKSRRPVRRDGR